MAPKRSLSCTCREEPFATKSSLNRHRRKCTHALAERGAEATAGLEAEYGIMRAGNFDLVPVTEGERVLKVQVGAMQKILEALQRDVHDLKTQLARMKTNNVSIGNVNNNISINNTHQHTNIIHVYAYGKIPRSMWPEKVRVQKMFKEPETCLPKYLKAKYFEKTETRCFSLPAQASQRVNVKVDDSPAKWTSRGKKSFVANLVEDGLQELLTDAEYNGKCFKQRFESWVRKMNNSSNYKPPPPHRAQAEINVGRMLVDGETDNFVNSSDMDRWEEDGGLNWGED